MGKIAKNFEELQVFKNARILTNEIYQSSRCSPFSEDFALVNQIRRAAISILSNIAEGFERNSTAEFIQYLHISKGSCGEVSAQLIIARDQNYINQQTYEALYDSARHISSMLSKYIAYLKKPPYRGPRYNLENVES